MEYDTKTRESIFLRVASWYVVYDSATLECS